MGTALSMACSYLDLDCKVFMVKCSYEQKTFRREVMRTYGADVTPAPSTETEVGRKILAEHPGTTGSLGCAGGGSNLGGQISPFMGKKLRGEKDYQFIAVEPASCPSLTRGVYAYDFCDTGMVCSLAKVYTLGSGLPFPVRSGMRTLVTSIRR